MCGTSSKWSHTAIFARYDDGLYLHHSTPNPGKFVGRGETEVSYGVMATKFSDELKSGWYNDVAVRKLKEPLTPDQEAKFFEFFEKTRGTPYEHSKLQLGYAACDWRCCGVNFCANAEDLDQFFCSEFVAASLRASGFSVLDTDGDLAVRSNVSEFTPADFSTKETGKSVDAILEPAQIHIAIPKDTTVSYWQAKCDCTL
jgi:hypothetical protein